MIIYQTKKHVESLSSNCIGVTGDNLAHTQEFYIKDIYDGSLTYSIHLRFADGSVNTVVPDSVQHDGEGTGLRWVVKKNDIFMHGYFELQIEGRNDEGLVFQTEIIELYADESIPVEDKQYENPNSETLKLRDETYGLIQTLSEQQTKLEENAKLLEQYDLDNKLDDKNGVIKFNHIADYAVTTQKLDDGAVTREKIEYEAVGEEELSPELLEKINSKLSDLDNVVQTKHIADKAVTNDKIANSAITGMKIASSAVSGNNIANNQINSLHIIDGQITKAKLSSDVTDLFDAKYNASNIEEGTGSFIIEGQEDKIKSATFEYQRVGQWVTVFAEIKFLRFDITTSTNFCTLRGLPYVSAYAKMPREMCITNNERELVWAVQSNSNELLLWAIDAKYILNNENLSFSFRYKKS